MAFTREFIRNLAKESGIELPKEFEDGLINEHISTRDAYAESQTKIALENNKPAEPTPVKDTQEYKAIAEELAQLKGEKTKAIKSKAAREIIKGAGIPDNRIDTILRVYDLDKLEVDENGKAKDFDKRKDAVAAEFADFIPKEEIKGGTAATPPVGGTAKVFTADDIRHMSPSEINKNWDDIKSSLKKGS